MFRTIPDAEIHIPAGLASGGGRVWRWMELALNIPYFFVTVLHSVDGKPSHERNLIFGDFRALIELAEVPPEGVELVRVNLLSPGYLNGSGSYRLDQLAEIWEDGQTGGQVFVLAGGTRMEMTYSDAPEQESAYQKVFSMPVH